MVSIGAHLIPPRHHHPLHPELAFHKSNTHTHYIYTLITPYQTQITDSKKYMIKSLTSTITTHLTTRLTAFSGRNRSKFVMTTASEEVGFSAPRLVMKKVLAKSQSEGDGAVVRRSIGRWWLWFVYSFDLLALLELLILGFDLQAGIEVAGSFPYVGWIFW